MKLIIVAFFLHRLPVAGPAEVSGHRVVEAVVRSEAADGVPMFRFIVARTPADHLLAASEGLVSEAEKVVTSLGTAIPDTKVWCG